MPQKFKHPLASQSPNSPTRSHSASTFRWITPAQFAAFTATQTDAHRLCSGNEGWIERLGPDALICFKNDAARDQMRTALAAWPWQPRRIFGKFLPRQNQERISPFLIEGPSSLPLEVIVQESGVRFGIDFAAGYSHGLFLDQRANRAFLRNIAPRRILNTFAYTCSFSLIAALKNAETTNIDLSKKSLDRGRANFSLNAISLTHAQQFIADDVLDVLPRLIRRGEKFDAIILDPPTFSRGNKGRRWQVEQHMEDLLSVALELASPSAYLLLSTNCAKLDPITLERMARYCLKVARLSATFHREPSQPDFPNSHGSSTLWLALR